MSQDKVWVERYLRCDGDLWVFSDVDDPDGSLPLESIGCTLSLRDVYERVALGDQSA